MNLSEFYVVYIEFTSKIADDRLNGLYLDYYIDPKSNTKKYLSTTLFAPNHARKAFPCFDEPGFKANFSISLGRKKDSGYSSISNMPLHNTIPIPEINGWVWDIFEETLPLPTYIVAMITIDFPFRSIWHDNKEIRLYAPEFLLSRTNQLTFTNSSELTHFQNPYLLQDPLVFIAKALEMWKNIGLGQYPLPKLDIIALPHFFFSAMENMGAITFKYPVILNVVNTTTTSELLRMNYVAGHEIVHQWFGNMMTPKSWAYVWLKESFSDLFSTVFMSEVMHKHYNNEDLVLNELQVALKYDGGPDAHPLENPTKTTGSVGEIYTDIPYRKGASVMHMARFFIGEKSFRKGLELLFQNRKYSNIDQNDLFNYLEEAQKMDNVFKTQGLSENITVTDILDTWTKQTCYPIIRVRRDGFRIILKQEEFKNGLLASLKESELEMSKDKHLNISGETNDEDTVDKLKYWWVPIKVYYNFNPTQTENYKIHWLPPNKGESSFLLNNEFHRISNVEGYYRLLYSMEELQSILKKFVKNYYHSHYLNDLLSTELEWDSGLRPVEKSQLLDDYFAFSFSNYKEVPVRLLFHIISTIMPFERDYVVWRTFLTNMYKPYQLLQQTDYFPPLQKYLLQFLRPVYSFLQSQKTSILTTPCSFSPMMTKRLKYLQFYSLIYSWMCRLGDRECITDAYEKVRGNNSEISNDEQEATYCASIKYASDEQQEELWNFFEKLYREEYFSVQRDRYSKALTCTRKVAYLKRVLLWTIDPSLDMHDIDRVTLLKQVIANPLGRDLILNFLDENFDVLYKTESVANPVTEALKAYVKYLNTNDKLEELQTFINYHSDAMESKKSFIKKQIKAAKLNILWMNYFAKDIGFNANYHLETILNARKQQTCSEGVDKNLDAYVTKITEYKFE